MPGACGGAPGGWPGVWSVLLDGLPVLAVPAATAVVALVAAGALGVALAGTTVRLLHFSHVLHHLYKRDPMNKIAENYKYVKLIAAGLRH